MTEEFDVAVVGGGIVGVAIARQYLLHGARVALLEREHDVLQHASGTNSSLLHCGFDANPLLLEARLVREGFALWEPLVARLGIVRKSGGLVVAWTDEEAARLPSLLDKGRRNNCNDARLLNSEETRQACPGLIGAKGSLLVPREYVADSWLGGVLLLHQALALGLKLFVSTTVDRILERPDKSFDLGKCRAKLVVNAGGVFADEIEMLRPGGPLIRFQSRPRHGQFAVFAAPRSPLSRIVYPVPTERTKGMVMWQNLGGFVVVGPTAIESDEKRPFVSSEVTAALTRVAEQRLKCGSELRLVASYCGVRPATEYDDYQIAKSDNWICVAGVRSTGFTASLAIAQHVLKLDGTYGKVVGPEDKRWFAIPEGFETISLHSDRETVRIGGLTHSPHPQTLLRLLSRL